MFVWETFFQLWILFATIVGVGERVHLSRLVEAAQPIQAGATKAEVLQAIGEPTFEWEESSILWFKNPERWVYGTTFNVEAIALPIPFANPIPVNIRLFGAAEDDLVFSWEAGKVTEIARPELDVPPQLIQWLEPYEYIRDVINEIRERSY